MADQEDAILSELASLADTLDYSEKSWIEVRDTLEKLKTWGMVQKNRCIVSETHVLQMKDIIMACKNTLCVQTGEGKEQQLILCLKALTEAFRFLRNCCAETPKNQNSIVSSGVLEHVMDTTVILLKPKFQESDKGADAVNDAVRSSLQLLGNTVVKNDITQQFVWKKCFPQFFLNVFSSTNDSVQDCLCMIIYNCLNEHSRLRLVSDHSGCKMISHIVHLCADKSLLEWGYFILDYLICNGLFPEMYQGIEFDPLARIILLDLFQVKITDALDEPSNKSREEQGKEDCYATSLGCIAEQFENHTVDITQRLQQLSQSSDDFFQVLIITRLLNVLSISTGLQSNLTGLQERISLLDTCVGLLKETAKPEVRETFSNVSTLPQGVDSGRLSPSHGFQRDLVRVIGNMCYRHTANQNKVRELEGIPLLLDHCNVDDHNPYICQWAIFAIRNILENNKENQSIVSSMDPRGLADTSRLRQFGVEAVELDSGRIKLVPIT
ncbi:Ataxin-10 [Desmophyllum pertusum]|uniref:Ataxin-10 n=1 Tax=Desmophyllum pertusum TaxID=174260 RepID=A0A9W9YQ56_9CNID|nr:Ataxin-10 [Desmophyllum pertusum]